MQERINWLIIEIEERKVEIEDIEKEFTEIKEQLPIENKLEIEIRETDLYFERLQRRTNDFEGDICEDKI